ncbi:hypothetical protein, partial [Phascolarctobacterium faecium]
EAAWEDRKLPVKKQPYHTVWLFFYVMKILSGQTLPWDTWQAKPEVACPCVLENCLLKNKHYI